MRLAVLADIHANLPALEAVLADLERQSYDRLLVLGDFVVKGPQPRDVMDVMHRLEHVAVLGNYDELMGWFPPRGWAARSPKGADIHASILYTRERLTPDQISYLTGLPRHLRFDWEGQKVELFHATPRSLTDITWPFAPQEELFGLAEQEETSVVLFGHVHHAFHRTVNGRWIINCGSVGLPFDGDARACYAMVNLEPERVSVEHVRVRYDVDAAERAAIREGMPDRESFIYSIRNAAYPYA